MTPMLRADLHVHTRHSRVSGNLSFLGSRDCYSTPADVYRVAKARGMDLVAFTDHDSIGGALELLTDRPDLTDVIVGEEVSCRLPDGNIDVHLAVYGMTEALHRDVQLLRRNVFDVIARLRDADVFFALNHLLHFYRGQIPLDRYLRLLDEVPALEVRNGTMLAAHNALVERIGGGSVATGRHAAKFAIVAGSDAHTLRRVGRTWTAAPGRTRDEFLRSVRQGLGRPGGVHGTTTTVAGDAYGVIAKYIGALAGFGPRDLNGARRAACLAFAAVSLPFQFTPLLMAARRKAGERRAIAQLAAHAASADREPVASPMEREPLRPSRVTDISELEGSQVEREPFRRAPV
jgi:predicted metal-dependent phosphoesterase TrpH